MESGTAQNVSWTKNVSCIIYSHCTRCHNSDNGLAAIPLSNYYETWAMRLAVKNAISQKRMPPYIPEVGGRNYSCQKSLTNVEIELINKWVDDGCPKGDTTISVPSPSFTVSAPTFSSPDQFFKTTSYSVPFIGETMRRCFIVSNPSNTEKSIQGIEVIPGNKSAVYSIFVYADTSSVPVNLDISDPGIGYSNFGGIGSSSAKLLYGWVNGSDPLWLKNNLALKVDSASRLVVQVEYVEDAGGKTDSTLINIVHSTSPTVRKIEIFSVLHHNQNLFNPPFIIPKDSVKTFIEKYTLSKDLTVFSVAPTLHYLCTSTSLNAILPLGDTIPLFETEDYGVIWSEGVYYFDRPLMLPVGTIIEAKAVFDNTLNNSSNPNNPPQDVFAGYSEGDEEMIFQLSYINSLSNDSALYIDETPHQSHYLNCNAPLNLLTFIKSTSNCVYPNPTSHELHMEMNDSTICEVIITDIMGKSIYKNEYRNPNEGLFTLDVSTYPKGVYFFYINNSKTITRKKIIIN